MCFFQRNGRLSCNWCDLGFWWSQYRDLPAAIVSAFGSFWIGFNPLFQRFSSQVTHDKKDKLPRNWERPCRTSRILAGSLAKPSPLCSLDLLFWVLTLVFQDSWGCFYMGWTHNQSFSLFSWEGCFEISHEAVHEGWSWNIELGCWFKAGCCGLRLLDSLLLGGVLPMLHEVLLQMLASQEDRQSQLLHHFSHFFLGRFLDPFGIFWLWIDIVQWAVPGKHGIPRNRSSFQHFPGTPFLSTVPKMVPGRLERNASAKQCCGWSSLATWCGEKFPGLGERFTISIFMLGWKNGWEWSV